MGKRRNAYTLLEIMVVVIIVALLAMILIPNFLRARKRSQASRVLEDLRMIDSAIDQYEIEWSHNPLFGPKGPPEIRNWMLSAMDKANLAFNHPETVGYGQPVTIQLVLSSTAGKDDLARQLSEPGKPQTGEIVTAPLIEAKLSGPGFEISPVNDERQNYVPGRTAEWRWNIRPKEWGVQSLTLLVQAKTKVGEAEETYPLGFFKRDLRINVVFPDTPIFVVRNDWEIVTGLTAGALGIFTALKAFTGRRKGAAKASSKRKRRKVS